MAQALLPVSKADASHAVHTGKSACATREWGYGQSYDAVGVRPFYRASLLLFSKGEQFSTAMHDVPFGIRKVRFSGRIPTSAKLL